VCSDDRLRVQETERCGELVRSADRALGNEAIGCWWVGTGDSAGRRWARPLPSVSHTRLAGLSLNERGVFVDAGGAGRRTHFLTPLRHHSPGNRQRRQLQLPSGRFPHPDVVRGAGLEPAREVFPAVFKTAASAVPPSPLDSTALSMLWNFGPWRVGSGEPRSEEEVSIPVGTLPFS
jgi:hypothetical protein